MSSTIREEQDIWGKFRNAQLEQAFLYAFNSSMVPVDVATSVIGIMYSTLLARKALELEGPTPSMMYAFSIAFYFMLTLVYIAGNRPSWIARRETFFLIWIPPMSFFSCWASRALQHLPTATPLLPLLVVIRSKTLDILWANMSMRLVFNRHAFIHLVILAKTMSINSWTCRWAMQNPDWVQLSARLTRTLRLLSRLVPLRPPPVAAGDECLALLSFSQLTLGYLLPCWAVWRLELASRARFLAAQHTQQTQQAAQQPTEGAGEAHPPPPPAHHQHRRARIPSGGRVWAALCRVWAAAAVASLSWHAVEGGVRALPAGWK